VDFEGIDLFEESEKLMPHTCRGLVPILSWDAESLRKAYRIKQKQVAHDALSSCLVSIISSTQRIARQQKSVGSGISYTLPTP
jgi:hypothetical protein